MARSSARRYLRPVRLRWSRHSAIDHVPGARRQLKAASSRPASRSRASALAASNSARSAAMLIARSRPRPGRGGRKRPPGCPPWRRRGSPGPRPGPPPRQGVAPRRSRARVSGRQPELLVPQLVGQPLVMEARGVDRLLHVHPEVHDVEDGEQHGIDDGAAARAPDGHEQLAVPREDGRRHAREHPLARGGEVGLGADQPRAVGEAGAGVEVAHLVVQQEAAAGDDDLRSVAVLERVGERDRVAVGVHHGQMCVVSLLSARPREARGIRDRRPPLVDGLAQLRGVLLRR